MQFRSATQPMNGPQRPSGIASPGKTPETKPRFTSQALFGKSSTVLIEHDGAVYQLRITGQNKLILTK